MATIRRYEPRDEAACRACARVPFELLDEPPGEYALVAELVVRDGFRRRGIARALLEAAERYARDAAASELRVGVLSENTPARQLYRSQGFAVYKETLAKSLDGPTIPALRPSDG